MKVRVDEERCQGHVLCNMACPEVFHLRDEDGHAYVPEENVPEPLRDKVRMAARSCPERAIDIYQD